MNEKINNIYDRLWGFAEFLFLNHYFIKGLAISLLFSSLWVMFKRKRIGLALFILTCSMLLAFGDIFLYIFGYSEGSK